MTVRLLFLNTILLVSFYHCESYLFCIRLSFQGTKNERWILKLNKIYLSVLGLWPESLNNVLFTLLFIYYGYSLILVYLTFYLALGNFRKVLRSITETITFTLVFYRLITLRRFNRQFGEVVHDMKRDVKLRTEKTDEEKTVISKYFGLCKYFSFILVTFLGTTVVMYFFEPIITQVSPSMKYTIFVNQKIVYCTFYDNDFEIDNFRNFLSCKTSCRFKIQIATGVLQCFQS